MDAAHRAHLDAVNSALPSILALLSALPSNAANAYPTLWNDHDNNVLTAAGSRHTDSLLSASVSSLFADLDSDDDANSQSSSRSSRSNAARAADFGGSGYGSGSGSGNCSGDDDDPTSLVTPTLTKQPSSTLSRPSSLQSRHAFTGDSESSEFCAAVSTVSAAPLAFGSTAPLSLSFSGSSLWAPPSSTFSSATMAWSSPTAITKTSADSIKAASPTRELDGLVAAVSTPLRATSASFVPSTFTLNARARTPVAIVGEFVPMPTIARSAVAAAKHVHSPNSAGVPATPSGFRVNKNRPSRSLISACQPLPTVGARAGAPSPTKV